MKKLSPLDIYNKEFNKTTFGGYKAEEVEDFLEEVGRGYEKLLKEINALKDENNKLREKLKNYESIEDKLKETLTSVQETAREQTKQARREAETIIKEANMKADRIIEETKGNLREEYSAINKLKETRELFRIRFRNFLESHLEMLAEEEEEVEPDMEVDIEEMTGGEGS